MLPYELVDWSCDLEPYYSQLVERPGNPTYLPIEPDLVCSIVPKLSLLDQAMRTLGYSVFKPKTMTLRPHSWGGLHIDSSATGAVDLAFNIPIVNGESMKTCWYDLPDHEELLWGRTSNRYRSMPPDQVEAYRTHEFLLTEPTLIRTDLPHNVDGRSSSVSRSMISIRWATPQGRLLTWPERGLVHQAVKMIS